MARVRFHVITDPLRGRIGGVVFRKIGGQLYASQRPNKPAVPASQSQTAHRDRFRAASGYATAAVQDPVTGPLYQKVANGLTTAYGVAISDYFRKPEIADIDLSDYARLSGGKIAVTAFDAIPVKSVTVALQLADGTVVEAGPAEFSGLRWHYTTTTNVARDAALTVLVTATDHAKNVSQRTVTAPAVR